MIFLTEIWVFLFIFADNRGRMLR